VTLPLPVTPDAGFPSVVTAADTAIKFALSQVGKPYQWGATGPNSYDCSGLMQTAWKQAGISLPRTALMQSRVGGAVPNIQSALPGDLVFPYIDESHVAMYLGNNQVVEAPTTGIPVHVVQYYASAGGIRRVDAAGGTAIPDVTAGATGGSTSTSSYDQILTVLKALSTPGDWASIGFITLGGILIGLVGWQLLGDKI